MANSSKQTRQGATFPWLWPTLLVIVGFLLLLDNFLLLGDFNTVALLPLLLVVAGTQVLLRGDLIPSKSTSPFAISRGSVESATLEVSAGAIDVDIRALKREGRLIAGRYAAGVLPFLDVRDIYAHIRMDRGATPWYNFADWQVGLATDLPWQLLVSTHIGQVELDMSGLIVHEAILATGIGDVRVTAPYEAFKPLYVRSTFGNIHVVSPPGYRTRIIIDASRVFRVKHDIHRYDHRSENVFEAVDCDADAPLVEITLRGTFGDAYLV